MTRPAAEDIAAASRFYSRLLRLYPANHREALGEQMLRTFEDSYCDSASATGRPPMAFWIAVIVDEGRSLLREYLTWVSSALPVAWLLAVLLLPSVAPAHQWAELLPPVAACAGLFLVTPGMRGFARPALAVIWLAIAAVIVVEAEPISDMADLVAPALLILCLLFSLKTVAGWHAMISGERVTGLIAEFAYGLPIGLLGVIGLALVLSPTDQDGLVILIFRLLVPVVGGAAAFMIGLRQTSGLSSLYSALAALLVGAAIWFLARPVLVEMSLSSSLFSAQVTSPATLADWHRALGPILFVAAIFTMAGAGLGHVVRMETRAPARVAD